MATVEINENQTTTNPTFPRRNGNHNNPFTVLRCLANVEMGIGCALFVIGVVMNFVLFICLGYCNQYSTKDSDFELKFNENLSQENHRKADSERFFFGEKELPVKCIKMSVISFIAMLLWTYAICMYGMILFWTNYRVIHGLHPTKYYSFSIKWIIIKGALLIFMLIVHKYFTVNFNSAPLIGLCVLTAFYSLYGLVLMCSFYQRLDQCFVESQNRVFLLKELKKNCVSFVPKTDSNGIHETESLPFNNSNMREALRERLMFTANISNIYKNDLDEAIVLNSQKPDDDIIDKNCVPDVKIPVNEF